MANGNGGTPNTMIEVLGRSDDRNELVVAAAALARSDDPRMLDQLGDFLVRPDFLARLDNVEEPPERVAYLKEVFEPLIARPSPEVARLCLRLATQKEFDDDLRMPFLLEALAQVRPMSADTVDLFRRTSEEGYFAFNAVLLAKNGSRPALDLFVAMMENRDHEPEERVDILHMGIAPNRTQLPILQMVAELLRRDVESLVTAGAVESVYDYRGYEWFRTHAEPPPARRSAPNEVLRFVIELANQARNHPGVPASLHGPIDGTVEVVRALLARRNT
jgi:mannitol/fructose-specific phosphotransferase system IIA component (Ntr-type)